MAKLKIPTRVPVSTTHPDGFDHATPNEQGYVNVVEKIILNQQNYEDFFNANQNKKAEILQNAAGFEQDGVTPCVVFMEQSNDSKVAITNGNCHIKTEKDKKKNPSSSGPAKFSIPLPDTPPANVDYLQKYAEIIHNLYAQGTPASKKRAHKFMFGMMLLTRCR